MVTTKPSPAGRGQGEGYSFSPSAALKIRRSLVHAFSPPISARWGRWLVFSDAFGTHAGTARRAAEASAKADRNDHVLVVIEMAGGNDGLNTLVPLENPLYYKLRPTLALPKKEVHQLSDTCGLHPRMGQLAEKYKSGQLAIVQGVGYPEPDRSHFRSMEIGTRPARGATAGDWLARPDRGCDVTGRS